MKHSTRHGIYPIALPMLRKKETENRMPAVRAKPFFEMSHPITLNTIPRNDVIRNGICNANPMLVPISCAS